VAEGFLAYSILESMTPGSTGYSQIRPRPNRLKAEQDADAAELKENISLSVIFKDHYV